MAIDEQEIDEVMRTVEAAAPKVRNALAAADLDPDFTLGAALIAVAMDVLVMLEEDENTDAMGHLALGLYRVAWEERRFRGCTRSFRAEEEAEEEEEVHTFVEPGQLPPGSQLLVLAMPALPEAAFKLVPPLLGAVVRALGSQPLNAAALQALLAVVCTGAIPLKVPVELLLKTVSAFYGDVAKQAPAPAKGPSN